VWRDSVAGEVVYVALGIGEDGYKEVLGFWIVGAEGESALVWKDILAELRERGLTEPLLFIFKQSLSLPIELFSTYEVVLSS
jgi:putative transposase